MSDQNKVIEILKTCNIIDATKIDLSKLRLDDYITVLTALGKQPRLVKKEDQTK